MKFVAHPLVVAVALGLLDPGVLTSELKESAEKRAEREQPPTATPPSAEEFARIELEWQSVRDLV